MEFVTQAFGGSPNLSSSGLAISMTILCMKLLILNNQISHGDARELSGNPQRPL